MRRTTLSLFAVVLMLGACTNGTTQPGRFTARLSRSWIAGERTFIDQNGSAGANIPMLSIATSSGRTILSKPVGLGGIDVGLPVGSYVLTLNPPMGFIGISTTLCAANVSLASGEQTTATFFHGRACAALNEPSGTRRVTYPVSGGPGATPIDLGRPGMFDEFADGHLWALQPRTYHRYALLSVDTATRSVSEVPIHASIPQPAGLAVGPGITWIVSWPLEGCHTGCQHLPGTVEAISTSSGRTHWSVSVPGQPGGIAFAGANVWETSAADGILTRIDATTGRVTGRVLLAPGIGKVGVIGGSVWVFGTKDLYRVDPASLNVTGRIAASSMSWPAEQGTAIGDGSIWLLGTAQAAPDGLYRVDPASSPLSGTALLHGWGGGDVLAGGGSLWLGGGTSPDRAVAAQMSVVGAPWVHVDPNSGTVLGPLIGASNAGVAEAAVGGGYVWIPDHDGRTILQIPIAGR